MFARWAPAATIETEEGRHTLACNNMVTIRSIGLLLLLGFCLGAAGCDGGEEEYSEEEPQTPEDRARLSNEDGEAALAESDRGFIEEGEKTWKQEALEYYDLEKNPANRTFEMPREWAVGFTKKLDAAGAEQVWVTRIFAEDFGDGNVINMSDDLLIVLPSDAAKRKAVFDLYNGEMDDEEMQLADIGQKYIFIVAD